MIRCFLSCFLLLSCTISYAVSVTVTDDRQAMLTLAHPAKRILSLAPDITEILFAVGAGAQIQGVVDGSDYPEAAKHIPIIGSYAGLDLERIVMLKPDLVITWGNMFLKQIQVLKKFGIAVYTTNTKQLEDIPRTMRNLGLLTGHEQQAERIAKQFNSTLAALQKQYAQQKSLRVFYQLGSYSLITINKQSWINQVITLCGGQNIFADALSITPEISWEAMVVANPQVVMTDATDAHWQQRWHKWPEIHAVRDMHLYSIPPDWIDRAGPRILLGAARMCEQIAAARSSA